MQITRKLLTIVSRKSRLALIQANIVKQQLQFLYPELEIVINGISTSGDEILDQPLNKIGGKGLFVKELENNLLQGTADIAVHSMKDMPALLPDGLALGAILLRADPRDVLCSAAYQNIEQLPQNSIVGTSSLRRQAQILAQRSDLKIVALRGNIETRLQKLNTGEYDAIILAAAGLHRLNLPQWLHSPIDPSIMLPAVGQGALGIEYRSSDHEIAELIAPLSDPHTVSCVTAERVMNAKLDGGCQAPVAGYATINGSILQLQGLVANADGSIIYRAEHSGAINHAAEIGSVVADELIAQGATVIIQELKKIGQLHE